jgi:predicted TPR repeat methyltransferase
VAIDPNFMYGHYNLGNVLRGKGELDAAIAAYRRAIALKGDFANAHFSLGNALGSKGLLEESITALRRALALDPGLRAAYVSLGLALRMVGRIDEAVAVYQQAIAVHPDAVECYCGLGDALIKKGLLQEAADVYRQAIAHDSNSAAAHRGLAGALEIQGDIPALIEALKAARAVAADPANHDFELAAFGVGDTPPAPPHSHIVSLFNEFAESFDRQLQKLQYIAPQLLFDAVRGLHPQLPMDIIDLGCGTGMCGELFRPMARKLVGVDLAPKMIEKSRQRGVYEELKEQDITVALQESPGQFDLIVAADLFIYIGYLDKVFQAAATALRPGGLLAFSIESADSGDYVLRRSRRYAQSADYIRRLASQFRFKEASIAGAILRTEGDLPVEGKIIVLQSANCSS